MQQNFADFLFRKYDFFSKQQNNKNYETYFVCHFDLKTKTNKFYNCYHCGYDIHFVIDSKLLDNKSKLYAEQSLFFHGKT